MTHFRRIPTLLALLALTTVGPAIAKEADVGPDAVGPRAVQLKDGLGTLTLPKGYAFIGPEKTQDLLNKKSGGASGNEVGLVLKQDKDADFAIILSYSKQGYVEDKDGDKLDANKILQELKDGTEESNKHRKENGVPEMHVVGWSEAPHYVRDRHVVIWGIDGSSGSSKIVNYNTRMLGREGVLSVNLVCDSDKLDKDKPESTRVQSEIQFASGKRYADYKPGDKISAGGIAALIIGGVLLKKAGILGFLLAFMKPLLVAGWKVIAVACAAVGSSVRKLFGRDKKKREG